MQERLGLTASLPTLALLLLSGPLRAGEPAPAPGVQADQAAEVPMDMQLLEPLLERAPELAPLLEYTPRPPGQVRHPAEFEPVISVWTTYPGWPDYDRFFLELVATLAPHAEVHVLVDPSARRRLRALLDLAGLGTIRLHADVPFETIWLRDYGPEPIWVEDRLGVLDPRYCNDCSEDEVVASRLAGTMELPSWRPPLILDGGHFLTNGRGTCLVSSTLADLNDMESPDLARVLGDWLGCSLVLEVEPLAGNVPDHVDMFSYFLAPDLVVVGQYAPEQDPWNHELLERNAALLAATVLPDGRPLRVVRIPMPDHQRPPYDEPILRSHANMIAVNDLLLVPVYMDTPVQVREALISTLQPLASGRVVVLLEADEVARDSGSLHCITRTVPMTRPRLTTSRP